MEQMGFAVEDSTPVSTFKEIIIFCDGACSGNPGPGGWGAIVAYPDGLVQELGGRMVETTNNQMELLATIEALRSLNDSAQPIIIYTDSVYVIKGITMWIHGWRRRDWTNAAGEPVANKEFWQRLEREVMRIGRKRIDWRFVRGHQGVPGNERVDEIAVEFSKGRRPELFRGSLLRYSVAIHDLPAQEALPENKVREPKIAPKGYLSLLGGVPMEHVTWGECERRVKGRSGAKFKKYTSGAEAEAILKSWGYSKKDLKPE